MSKITIKDILSYIQGNIRYKLYYSRYNWLIRKHIREQIEFRIQIMNPTCYSNGSCIACGCKTTALQMTNKSCDKDCYPTMMNKTQWNYFSKGIPAIIKKEMWLFKPEFTQLGCRVQILKNNICVNFIKYNYKNPKLGDQTNIIDETILNKLIRVYTMYDECYNTLIVENENGINTLKNEQLEK